MKAVLQDNVIGILLILVVGFVVYSNTFVVPFMYDDEGYIIDNPALKDIDYFKNPSKIDSLPNFSPSEKLAFRSRILCYLTFSLNYRLHGLNVTGYHIFNLFIHLTNALLVYVFLILTFKTPFFKYYAYELKHHVSSGALFCALIFVSHPIQTQAVTYISQRFTSLATLLYLFSLALYIGWRHSQASSTRLWIYASSLLLTVLAMLTKEICFTLPVIIALYEFTFFDGKVKRRALSLIPFLLTMLIIPLRLLTTDMHSGTNTFDGSMRALAASRTMPRTDYLFTQFRGIVTYLRLMAFPVNQNFDYDYPIYNSFFAVPVLLSFFFLLGIGILGVYLIYRSRKDKHGGELRLIAFGIFWFFITLSIESSIIPIADIVNEHRIYLPSVGAIIAFVTAVVVLGNKLKTKLAEMSWGVMLALTLIVFIFAGATYARNNLWRDEMRFKEDVVRMSPAKARPHLTLGILYHRKGRIDDAIKEYLTSIRLNYDSDMAHFDLANAYMEKGHYKEAEHEYISTVELGSVFAAMAYNNLGIIYAQDGHMWNAVEVLKTAITLNSLDPDFHCNLGKVYMKMGLYQQSLQAFQRALQLNPRHEIALFYLSSIGKIIGK